MNDIQSATVDGILNHGTCAKQIVEICTKNAYK